MVVAAAVAVVPLVDVVPLIVAPVVIATAFPSLVVTAVVAV